MTGYRWAQGFSGQWRALLLCFALTLAPFHSIPADEAPIRIGLSLGLTGKYAKLAEMLDRAYRLWVRDVNQSGGLLGRPVEIVIKDDQSSPEVAVELYRELIHDSSVDLVFGPYSSAITAAVAPVVEKAGYPMLAAGAASDTIWQQGYTNIFGVFTPASRYALGMLDLALLNDLTTIAIVYPNDPFSVSAAGGVKKWAPKLGLDVVMFEKFEKGQRDLVKLARKIALVQPSMVMMTGHFNESVDMRIALKKVGWYPAAYYATIGPVLGEYREILGEDADLSFANSFWEPMLKYPQSQRFAASFRAEYGVTPSYQAADAYAAGQILERAVISANSLSRDKIRSSLRRLEMQTVIGRYGVDATGVQVKHFALTIQWQEGKKEIVWPEELATAKPIFK